MKDLLATFLAAVGAGDARANTADDRIRRVYLSDAPLDEAEGERDRIIADWAAQRGKHKPESKPR